MNSTIVDLYISPENYQKLYAGAATDVYAHDRQGRSVRFPAWILQPYVDHGGVRGSFLISFDAENRFRSIERL